jgi:hypothetical protein
VQGERTIMANETNTGKVFDIEKCRAQPSAGDLVDCLSPKQAHLCGSSFPFGSGHFCKHSRRKDFIEITENSQRTLISPPDILQSDNQE